MKYSDQEIYENRLKWIEYLELPTTVKHTGQLENTMDTNARCCIGHACYILGLDREVSPDYDGEPEYTIKYDGEAFVAPYSLINKLGLWGRNGASAGGQSEIPHGSLAHWNDSTVVTPQEIGAYLRKNILGGNHTPFIPIKI